MGDVLFPRVVHKMTDPYLPLEPVFAQNTWEMIVKACQKNRVPDTWAVGAQKAMTINGTEYMVDIIGKHHDDYADGSGKAPLTFQMHDLYATKYAMGDGTAITGGWGISNMRNKHLPVIFGAMPVEVRSNIKEVRKFTSKGLTQAEIEETADKLFLLSEIEIFGVNTITFSGEGVQYAYYANGGIPKKTLNGSGETYWERSPDSRASSTFGTVLPNGNGVQSQALSNLARGVSPAFCF
jgi:hypothetical protein